jgi:hypothetical protein
MIGDAEDFQNRLTAVLPTRWFADESPVRDAILAGLATGWSWSYGLLQYVKCQSRIASASGIWLDVIARDFFGSQLQRWSDQDDDAFRIRIQREVFRERATRAAVASVLQDLTGRAPAIFEPARPTDTGCYGSLSATATGCGYNIAGGWGSLLLPFQCFVTAYRPMDSGITLVAGWNSSGGGYGIGAIEYADLSMVQGEVTDDVINAAIASVMPAAAIAWTRISN